MIQTKPKELSIHSPILSIHPRRLPKPYRVKLNYHLLYYSNCSTSVYSILVGLYDTIGKLLTSDDEKCRNLSSEIFSVMCTHNIARTASIKFIPNLASLFNDSNRDTRVNVHKTLFCLADNHVGQIEIVNNKLVPTLISLLKKEKLSVKFWIVQTLCKVLRIAALEALSHNGLETLAELLNDENQDPSILENALRAIAEITYPHRVKSRANNHSSLPGKLVEILKQRKSPELSAAAAGAIATMAITTEGKTKFFNLDALSACCDLLDDDLSESRLNGITAICIIGEVPAGREFILEHKLDKIKQLTSDPDYLVRIAAQECFQVIKWKP
jgi:HEAT repeat protein